MYKNLLLTALFLLSACGGGGGGGGSSDSSGTGNTNARQGIRLIHSAIDFAPLALNAATGQVDQARFAEASYHGKLASGLQNLNLVNAASGTVSYWSAAVDLQDGQRKTILVYGGYKDQNLRVSVLNDAAVDSSGDFAYVRFINGFTDSAAANFNIPNLVQSASVNSGSASAYVPVVPGAYDFLVDSAGVTVGRVSSSVSAGKAYSVIGQGVPGYFVSSNLLED